MRATIAVAVVGLFASARRDRAHVGISPAEIARSVQGVARATRGPAGPRALLPSAGVGKKLHELGQGARLGGTRRRLRSFIVRDSDKSRPQWTSPSR